MEINEIKTKEDIIKYVKSTDKKDIGQDLFNYLFGYIENKGPRFKVNQSITLKPGDIFNNKEPIKTCIGNYLINYLVFNENIFKHLGFINKRMDGDTLSEIDDKISYLLLNDYITTKDVIYYLDRLQFFGFSLTSLITTSLSPKVMFELPEVKKRKEELYKKYKKEIDNNDIVVMNKIEQELMDLAKSIIKDDPGYDLYKSGSKASFANNYKLMNISKGVMNDLQTGGYKVSMASYEEGVPKDQVDKFANGMVSAEYAKGIY